MRSRSTAHGAHELGVADQLYTRLIGGIQRLCVTFMCYICVCIYVLHLSFVFVFYIRVLHLSFAFVFPPFAFVVIFCFLFAFTFYICVLQVRFVFVFVFVLSTHVIPVCECELGFLAFWFLVFLFGNDSARALLPVRVQSASVRCMSCLRV